MKPAFKDRALLVASILLLSSASVRLGAIAVPAVAKEARAPIDKAMAAEAPKTGKPASGLPDIDGETPSPDSLRLVLKALQDRKRDLDTREQAILERERALEKADHLVSKKLAELEQAEQKLRASLSVAEDAADKDIGRLVNVYEKMPPKDSAILFQQMEPKFAAGFLARMRPETAAGILAGMDPEAAYAISAVLAGRNMQVPKR